MPRPLCVLIVDDDDVANYVHTELLNDLGLNISLATANNGREALEIVRKGSQRRSEDDDCFPDVIFLDINMPVMNGLEFLEKFAAEFPDHTTDIFLMITSEPAGDVEAALHKFHALLAGRVDKPLNKEEVVLLLTSIQKELNLA